MTKYFVNKAVKKFIVSYTADEVGGKRHYINGGIVVNISKLYTVQIPLDSTSRNPPPRYIGKNIK